MSNGPYYAFIEKISPLDDRFEISVLQKDRCQNNTIFLPIDVEISHLKIGDNICYYLCSCDNEIEKRVVLLFKHDKDSLNPFRYSFRTPILKDWFYVYKGDKILELKELPQVINLLLTLSTFYSKRYELVKKSLDILDITQDPCALDAIFSMRPEKIYELLGDNVCLCSNDLLMQLEPYSRNSIIEDSFIPVQIADLLVNLKLSGVDIYKPFRRDLPQVLTLAVIHGTPYEVIKDFFYSYKRE
jgi:hypothetical protein